MAARAACRDWRTDVCDCAGAEESIPSCAAVVTEVRATPLLRSLEAIHLAAAQRAGAELRAVVIPVIAP